MKIFKNENIEVRMLARPGQVATGESGRDKVTEL